MNKNILLNQYQIIPGKLLEFGFRLEQDTYILKKELNQELNVEIKVCQDLFEVDVYENDTNEKYIPFYIKEVEGVYVSNLKAKIEFIIQDIMKCCFESLNIRNQILSYVKERYRTIPEYSWDKYPNYFTLKTKNTKKWYGLVIDIPGKTLGLKGDELVDAINLKNDPGKIQTLIDYKNFFPAYHMNKKYWVTILLDKNVDFNLLKQLIDESYSLVEKM